MTVIRTYREHAYFVLCMALCFFQCFSRAGTQNHDTLLYLPIAGIHQNQALLEESLFAEHTPSSFSAYVADARAGGSGLFGKIMFPIFNSDKENKRSNGWAIGAATGIQRDALHPSDIVVPGYITYEVATGRATTESWTVSGTGLRGYLELALRNQRPLSSTRPQNRLALTSQIIEKDNYFLAFRMGASSDNEGSGLVTQKPGFLSWAFQTALYVPLQSKQGYANMKLSSYRNCIGSQVKCGVNLLYVYLFKGIKKPKSEFASHFVMGGPFLKYFPSENMSLDFELFESFVSSSVERKSFRFKSERNSYSVLPGVKFNLVFGF